MTSHVLPRRFINTPTVMELYEAEHKEDVLDLAEEDVEKLSDEYNEVTGTESHYYRLLFEEIHSARQNAVARTGNEGLGEWAKDMVTGFINMVKKFFKWIWSFFGGKQEAQEQKNTANLAAAKLHGVKSGEVPYPKAYLDLWGKPTKVPGSLEWVKTEIGAVIKAADMFGKHLTAFTKVVNSIDNNVLKKSGDQSAELDKLLAAYGKEVQTIYGAKEGQWEPWAGIGVVQVSSKTGKVTISTSKILPKKESPPTFKTNLTLVNGIFEENKKALAKWADIDKEAAKLESTIIKSLNDSISFSGRVGEKDQAPAKEVVTKVKKLSSDMMVTIKAADNLFLKLLAAAGHIVYASVSTTKGDGDDD